jgi:hypothetical protein
MRRAQQSRHAYAPSRRADETDRNGEKRRFLRGSPLARRATKRTVRRGNDYLLCCKCR